MANVYMHLQMDVDLESVEIVFAQKLACGEPPIRQRALQALHKWIKEQSTQTPFKEEDMTRLCKGLHYVLWMQDKMLLQEEMADNIASLLNVFSTEDEKVLYVLSSFKSLSKEWPFIDKWRMDKFLMAMRRLLRVCFAHLASLKWKKSIRDKYWAAFQQTTMSTEGNFCDGLKFHFASLILDEMDTAGGLTKKQVTECLKPFVTMLDDASISTYLFTSILDEVFMTMLHQRSEELAEKAVKEANGEAMDEPTGIQFDYNVFAGLLFDIGKKPETISSRRSRLYKVSQMLKEAAEGRDPLELKDVKPKAELVPKDFSQALGKLIREANKVKKSADHYRKTKKKNAFTSSADGVCNVMPEITREKTKRKKYSGPEKREHQKNIGMVKKGPKIGKAKMHGTIAKMTSGKATKGKGKGRK